ncbi:MAG: hypothetical protein ABSD20_00125 [Terriglobales bacterium]|jgi:hypothetical protein
MRIKPFQVKLAVALMWLSIAASPVKSVFERTHLRSLGSFVLGDSDVAIDLTLLLSALLFWKVGQGRNWARFAFLACFIAGLLPYSSMVKTDFFQWPGVAALEIAGVVFQCAALALLFTRPGRDWFRAEHDPDTMGHDSKPAGAGL